MRVRANTHTQTRTQVLTRTFPGGDESGQELAEVGAGIGVVQRKGFQLGGRASVLDVGLLHSADVRLQESCSAERGRNFMEGRKLRAIRRRQHLSVGSSWSLTFRRGRGGALAGPVELGGGEGEPEAARTQDRQHDTHTQPGSHL